MTGFGSTIAAFLARGAVAARRACSRGTRDGDGSRMALVIDAAAARDGRELVDARLRDSDAQVRLPRTAAEARTDVRYFAAQGYRVVVAGPRLPRGPLATRACRPWARRT